jgi:hypothetical protein
VLQENKQQQQQQPYIATDQLLGGGGLAKILDTILNAQFFSLFFNYFLVVYYF